MKSFKHYMKEDKLPTYVGWFPISNIDDLEVGGLVRIPDGLGKVQKIIKTKVGQDKIHIEILHPIHDDVKKGDSYEYVFDEITILGQKLDRKIIKKSLGQILDSRLRKSSKGNEITIHPVLERLEFLKNIQSLS